MDIALKWLRPLAFEALPFALVAAVTVPPAAIQGQDLQSTPTGAAASRTTTPPATQAADPFSSGPRISGLVRDATSLVRFDEEFIRQLAEVKSEEDFLKLAQARPRAEVRAKITVHLRGQTAGHTKIARETITDDHGQYTFDDLPEGAYEVWAELPSKPAGPRASTPAAMGRATVRVGAYPGPNAYARGRLPVYSADLDLRSDMVTVRGRVTNTEGIPIAGAAVTCADQFDEQDQRSETSEGDRFLERRTVSGVTGADGSYELRGINPPGMWQTAGYLNGGSGAGEVKRAFEVKADGYRPATRTVPLVSEELRDKSRRVLATLQALRQRALQTQPSTRPAPIIGEKPGLPLPASRGSIITGVDFILPPANAPTPAAAGP